MHEKILIVLDNLSKNNFNIINSYPIGTIKILPIGVSISDLKENLTHPYEIVDYNLEQFEQFQQIARNYYIKLPWEIFNLSPFKNRPDYIQLLSFSEKSFWKSQIPHLVWKIEQITNAQDFPNQKIIYFIEDFHLKSITKQDNNITPIHISLLVLLSALKEVTKLIIKKTLLTFSRLNRKKVSSSNLLFSFYPGWINFDQNQTIKETYFGEIIQPSFNKDWGIVLMVNPFKNFLKKVFKDQNLKKFKGDLFFVESFVHFRNILFFLNPNFYFTIFKDIQKVKNWNKVFDYKNFDLSPVIKFEIIKSFYDGGYFSNLIYLQGFRKLNWNQIKHFFYRLEFQPFENTFLGCKYLNPKTVFWGFQNSIYGKNFMAFQFPTNIFNNFNNFLLKPDKFLCTNFQVKHELIAAGILEPNIYLIGPLRFQKLFSSNKESNKNEIRNKNGFNSDEFIIFMPISQLISENKIMFQELGFALQSLNFKFKLIIKLNPNKLIDPVYVGTIKEELEKNFDINTYQFSSDEIDYYDYIKLSDLVFLSGGSTPLEALILKTPTIIFNLKYLFVHNPFAEFKDIFEVVSNHSEIKNSLNKILIDKKFPTFNAEQLNTKIFGSSQLDPVTEFWSLFNANHY